MKETTKVASKLHLKENPTLRDIQDYVKELEKERGFTHQTILEVWVLVTEEIGELAKCVRKSATSLGTDTEKQYSFDAAGELADLIIVLSAVANRLGVDLEQAFRNKEEANKQRKWAK